MVNLRVLDVTAFDDLSDQANPVPTLLVAWLLEDGRPGSTRLPRMGATKEAILTAAVKAARATYVIEEDIQARLDPGAAARLQTMGIQ
jgi:hypothetical protein